MVRGWGEASPSRRISADTMTAGFLGTRMARGEAEWRQGARWAEAAEAVFPIYTGASLATWAGHTLVDLHIAKRPWGTCRQPHLRTRTIKPMGRDN